MSTMLNLFGLFRKSLNVLIVRTLGALSFVAVVATGFFTNVLAVLGLFFRSFLLICRSVLRLILKNVLIFCEKCLDIFS